MTRKHFQAIADALNASRTCWAEHPAEDYPDAPDGPDGSICPEQAQWLRTRDAIARELAAFNPNFDRGRFVRATER